MAGKAPAIGVLALQGDTSLHMRTLEALGCEPIAVKAPSQLHGIDGLIIPGGESTALLRLCEPIGMLPAITAFAKAGGAVLGTCAGAILLAANVTNPAQSSLGLIDITVERNGYGRQLDSAETAGQAHPPFGKGRLPMTFIRAPRIRKVGNQVKVLATHGGEPVMVSQNNIMAATFHPELQDDGAVHHYWLGTIS